MPSDSALVALGEQALADLDGNPNQSSNSNNSQAPEFQGLTWLWELKNHVTLAWPRQNNSMLNRLVNIIVRFWRKLATVRLPRALVLTSRQGCAGSIQEQVELTRAPPCGVSTAPVESTAKKDSTAKTVLAPSCFTS